MSAPDIASADGPDTLRMRIDPAPKARRATRYVLPTPASIPPRVQDPRVLGILALAKIAIAQSDAGSAGKLDLLAATADAVSRFGRYASPLEELAVYAIYAQHLDPDAVADAIDRGAKAAREWRRWRSP